MIADPRIARPITLIRSALRRPPGTGHIVLALCLGAPWPWAALSNAALIAQFGPLPLTAILIMGMAHKPADARGDSTC